MIAWYLLMEKEPFENREFDATFGKEILMGLRLPLDDRFPLPLRDLIASCWRGKSSQRVAASQIVTSLKEMLNIPITPRSSLSSFSSLLDQKVHI